MQNNDSNKEKKVYVFGEIKEYDLEKIESEVLQESVYLDVFAGSDLAFKENVMQMDKTESLNKISQLNAYKFQYKTSEFPEHQFASGDQIGFMAQEVAAQFPELIKKDPNGHMFVNYMGMVPVMAEAIKELSLKVEKLEAELAKRI